VAALKARVVKTERCSSPAVRPSCYQGLWKPATHHSHSGLCWLAERALGESPPEDNLAGFIVTGDKNL
jgi:hypothetical protein